MCGSQIAALVDELARAELATCDRVALARLVAKAQKAHSWLDAFDARAAQRVAKLAQADAGDRQAAVLGGGGRRSGREAAAVERQAKALELLPQLGEALAAGEVSAGHVDAVARTVADLDDAGRERLRELDAAVTDAAIGASSVEAFEKETRELSRLLSPDDGLDRARAASPATLVASLDRSPDRDVPHPSRARPGDRRPRRSCAGRGGHGRTGRR